jgi:hypothetical protein
MDKSNPERTFGVFRPTGHLVISFPTAKDQDGAAQQIGAAGLEGDAITRYSPAEMLAQTTEDLARAGVMATIGQDLNLVKAHRELAERGYHFLVVKVDNDAQARQIADIAEGHHAERAQHYGRFIIEEMIEHGDEEHQVKESPDTGLDAQTPSGNEGERTARHRPT